MELLEQKQSIRGKILSERERLALAERQGRSRSIAKQLLELPEFGRSSVIHLYLAVRSEVETGEIFKAGLALGKIMAVPVMTSEAPTELRFGRVEQVPPRNLEKGPRGILQPPWDERIEVLVEQIDLWVIPGVVFDLAGRRIGYGGGFYDRVLKKARGPVVALAFELQMVEEVPEGIMDVRVHRIITEKRSILCPL